MLETSLLTKDDIRLIGQDLANNMSSRWLFCFVFLIEVGELVRGIFRSQCTRRGVFRLIKENHRLDGYVNSTREVSSLLDCQLACLAENHCSSYNFQVSGNPLHVCELNNEVHDPAWPGEMQAAAGYEYHEPVQNTEGLKVCESNPCLRGGTCQSGCMEYPYYICRCPEGFTGKRCEKLKRGNFVIRYDSDTPIGERKAVQIPGTGVVYGTTICLWIKPNQDNGIVFSYGTTAKSDEIEVSYDASRMFVGVLDRKLEVQHGLPFGKWSHFCLGKTRHFILEFYLNGLKIYASEIPEEEDSFFHCCGYILLGAAHVNGEAGTLDPNTRTTADFFNFHWWSSMLNEQVILYLYNRPRFNTVILKKTVMSWDEFYDSKLSLGATVVYPSNGPEEEYAQFQLTFSGPEYPAYIPITEAFISKFTICLWFKINENLFEDGQLLHIENGDGVRLKITLEASKVSLIIGEHKWTPNFEFYFNWYSLCASRDENNPNVKFTVDAYHTTVYNVDDYPLIDVSGGGYLVIGSDTFAGQVACVNMWLENFKPSMTSALTIEPGYALGNYTSWDEASDKDNAIALNPPTAGYRGSNFDFVFPSKGEGNFLMGQHYSQSKISSMKIAFWIKMPRANPPFTILSMATPAQLHELNIHFGTMGIWFHLAGEKRLFPMDFTDLFDTWQYYMFYFYGSNKYLQFWFGNSRQQLDNLKSGEVDFGNALIVIGSQQVSLGVVAQHDYQFHGETSQVNIWNAIINHDVASIMAARCISPPGNILSWPDVKIPDDVPVHGIYKRDSECLATRDGEL